MLILQFRRKSVGLGPDLFLDVGAAHVEFTVDEQAEDADDQGKDRHDADDEEGGNGKETEGAADVAERPPGLEIGAVAGVVHIHPEYLTRAKSGSARLTERN